MYVWSPHKKSRDVSVSVLRDSIDLGKNLDFLRGNHTYPKQLENAKKLGALVISFFPESFGLTVLIYIL